MVVAVVILVVGEGPVGTRSPLDHTLLVLLLSFVVGWSAF